MARVLRQAALLLLVLPLASSFSLSTRSASHLRTSAALAQSARHATAVPTMGVMDVIKKLFGDSASSAAKESPGAGSTAKNRLRLVLASDRTGLDELTMEKIRAEIQEVIAKCVRARGVVTRASMPSPLVRSCRPAT